MAPKIKRTQTIDCDCSVRASHGTAHNYNWHRCGCQPCRSAHQLRRKMRAAGHTDMTSAERSRNYIRLLGERHYSQRMIARELDTYPFTINRIAQGKVQKVLKSFEHKLLSIPLPPMDQYENEARVHGTLKRYYQGCRCDLCRGARNEYLRELRRRQSKVWAPEGETYKLISRLLREGHTRTEVAQRSKIAKSTITRIMDSEDSKTYRTTHEQIARAFRKDPENAR